MQEAKIAIIHDYMTAFGGAERVLKAIHDLFPKAVVFTSSYDPESMPEEFKTWEIRTTGVDKLPLFSSLSKHYTALYPVYFENFDLSEFDIIISSSTAWSKAVITKPHQLHICYCHTPARFLYKYSGESNKRNTWYYKPFVGFIDNILRTWDFASAQRPNFIVANSNTVADRIRKFYRREPDAVIYPPVKTEYDVVLPQEGAHRIENNYFLMVSRLSAYKNVHLVIEAFNRMKTPLRIVGAGKEIEHLKKIARMDIAFLGKVSERELNILYQNSKGLIFPVQDEDFGISPVEAMAHGKPVLSHKSGGPTEYIEEGKTGMFFDDISVEGIINAVDKFDAAITANTYDSGYIKQAAKRFDEKVFAENFRKFVEEKWTGYAGAPRS